MPDQPSQIQSIAVIGAGIIGLSCALQLADRGIEVSIYEPNWSPRGASWAAAGMLAPAFEAASAPGTHPRLFELCDASARLWSDWAAMLEDRSGRSAGFVPGPSLAVAQTEAEAARLVDIQARLAHHVLPPEPCLTRLSGIEPAISSDIRAALLLPSDGQVDNRRTLDALIACVTAEPRISIHTNTAPLRLVQGDLDHAGHDATLVTAGWQSPQVSVLVDGAALPLSQVEPVFETVTAFGGQMLSVAPVADGPAMTIRCGDLYVVPKQDRLIIGATTEPGRTNERPDAEAIQSLHDRASALCPTLAQAPVIETWAGIRPGTRDHAPLIGKTRLANLFVATGHFRNGILLAPLTAQIVTDLILDATATDLARAFSPKARAPIQV